MKLQLTPTLIFVNQINIYEITINLITILLNDKPIKLFTK